MTSHPGIPVEDLDDHLRRLRAGGEHGARQLHVVEDERLVPRWTQRRLLFLRLLRPCAEAHHGVGVWGAREG